jgi:hypothetical protein
MTLENFQVGNVMQPVLCYGSHSLIDQHKHVFTVHMTLDTTSGTAYGFHHPSTHVIDWAQNVLPGDTRNPQDGQRPDGSQDPERLAEGLAEEHNDDFAEEVQPRGRILRLGEDIDMISYMSLLLGCGAHNCWFTSEGSSLPNCQSMPRL